MGYIDVDIFIPEEPVVKVEQVRVINKGKRNSTIVFKYPNSVMEQVLYSANPDCEHEIQAQFSGIKCIKCGGWYCA